jgi:hypothetical protein
MKPHVETNDEKRDGLMTATCEAFPNGIPTVMKGGELEPRFRRKKPKSGKDGWWESPRTDRPWFFNHEHPYPGDNGLLYDPTDDWLAWLKEVARRRREEEADQG